MIILLLSDVLQLYPCMDYRVKELTIGQRKTPVHYQGVSGSSDLRDFCF